MNKPFDNLTAIFPKITFGTLLLFIFPSNLVHFYVLISVQRAEKDKEIMIWLIK